MSDQQQPKLGPSATYRPDDPNDKNPVQMAGVTFFPGEAVDLEDRLGQQPAQAVLKKLAGNRFFQVDGGPDWQEQARKRQEAEQQDQERTQKLNEERSQQQRQAQQGAAGATGAAVNNENGQVGTLPEPPEDWEGPPEATLESSSVRPNAPPPDEADEA
jgi:hypothetical protein